MQVVAREGEEFLLFKCNPHNQLSENMGKDKKNLAWTLKLDFQLILVSP